ncbi:acetylxylan esterase [Sphaerisporangium perillae]|uniref:acetylxylan esterase n=1 Tax=Sphaerisporangium perillae TaxID=2935860 RepID=UPI00200EF818|nr:acetylxylan esterase [Sphaerisporangium perillae]
MTADSEQADLWAYRSSYEAPADFDAFWRDTLDDLEIALDAFGPALTPDAPGMSQLGYLRGRN